MQNGWLDHIVAWISANPIAAGGVIFLIAFCDAVIVLGIVVPALPLLFAVGTLIGLGHLDGPYALLCAAAGAFVGDAMSYWVGYHWGPTLRQRWPFRRYPQLIDRGERLFRRHGTKGILIARYVGAVRPFVPAVEALCAGERDRRVELGRLIPWPRLALRRVVRCRCRRRRSLGVGDAGVGRGLGLGLGMCALYISLVRPTC
jgi:membrane protein YqaA with SNARE-associated domain